MFPGMPIPGVRNHDRTDFVIKELLFDGLAIFFDGQAILFMELVVCTLKCYRGTHVPP